MNDYLKKDNHFYCLLDTIYIEIVALEDNVFIIYTFAYKPKTIGTFELCENCTKEEFDEKYKQALNYYINWANILKVSGKHLALMDTAIDNI